MVNNSLEAAKILENHKVSVKVVNMHTIKPIDEEAILNSNKSKLIVSIEEHNIIGGLGSAIAEYNSKLPSSPKQLFIGIKDTYSKGGTYKFLKEKHGLSPEKIVDDILNEYKKLMDNKQKYQEIFVKSLSIKENQFSNELKYNEIPEWDSIGHMTLISGLEEGFGISIETDDIIDFSSVKKGEEILGKYNIKF